MQQQHSHVQSASQPPRNGFNTRRVLSLLGALLLLLNLPVKPVEAQIAPRIAWMNGWNQGAITAVAFSPNGTLAAVGGTDTTIKVLRTSDGTLVHTLTGQASTIRALAFSPDGKILAVGTKDFSAGTVTLWNTQTGSFIRTLSTNAALLTFSPDGQTLAVSTTGVIGSTILLFRVSDGSQLSPTMNPFANIASLAFAPDGQTIASGGDGRTGAAAT